MSPDTERCLDRDYQLTQLRSRFDRGLITCERSFRLYEWHERFSQKYPVCLFIDADMVWSPDTLSLILHGAMETRGICAPAVPKDRVGQGLATSPGRGAFQLGNPQDEEFVRVHHRIGAGMMAIHRDVIDRIGDEFPWHWQSDLALRYKPVFLPASEPCAERPEYLVLRLDDGAFCDRVLDAGVPISVALRPRVAHIGAKRYTLADAVAEPVDDVYDPVTEARIHAERVKAEAEG